ncbi:Flp pilus assembly protein CpaB [bacterium]|nr:Flp pilus assembly protein CpaB [bacterium]
MIKVRSIIIVALVLSGAVTYGLYQYMENQKVTSEEKDEGYKNVILANVHLPIGTKIEESNVRRIAWPAKLLPKDHYSEISQVVGRVMKAEAFPGDVIIESKLAPIGSEGGFSSIIPPGMRALTVEVNTYVGVGGFILPNTRVDVLVTVASYSDKDEASTRIILENIKVLAVDQTFQRKGDDPVTVQTVTLLVTPDQAEKLVLASTEGKLQLTLRNDSDNAQMTTSGVQLKELVAKKTTINRRITKPSASRNKKVVEVIHSGEREEITFEDGERKE